MRSFEVFMSISAMPLFDTLLKADNLRAVGIPDDQARATVRVVADALEVNLKELATKSDLESLRTELKRDTESLRTEFKSDMKLLQTEFKSDMTALEQRMLIKLGSLMVVGVSAVAALAKVL
jgi:hypothetical protein